MTKSVSSLLDEISKISPSVSKYERLEVRASHVLTSAINILEMIEDNFSDEEKTELQKRFMLAVKNKNPKKFLNGLQKLKENSEDDKADK